MGLAPYQIARLGVGEAARIGDDRSLVEARHHGGDRGRVDAAGEQRPQAHIGDHPPLHRALQQRVQLACRIFQGAGERLARSSLGNLLRRPVADRRSIALAAAGPHGEMATLKLEVSSMRLAVQKILTEHEANVRAMVDKVARGRQSRVRHGPEMIAHIQRQRARKPMVVTDAGREAKAAALRLLVTQSRSSRATSPACVSASSRPST